jgi:hypothetical protein
VNTGGGAAGASVCDPDVEVNSVTSCPFARNVRDPLYATNFVEPSLDVYSPTTGQTHTMSCVINDVPIVCTGGNNAAVYVWP